MKEFNFELARQGKPVCTRDGKPARIICFDRMNDLCPIVALVKINTEEVFGYLENGRYCMSEAESPLDLMMAEEKKEGWMAIYSNVNSSAEDITPASNIYKNRETLESLINKDKVRAVIKVEWEE